MPTLVLQATPTGSTDKTLYLRRLYPLTGVTRTSAGVALGLCAVHVFRTLTDIRVDRQTSDSAGNYTATVYDRATYYVVGNTLYTADSTLFRADSAVLTADLTEYEGVTVNTLQGS